MNTIQTRFTILNRFMGNIIYKDCETISYLQIALNAILPTFIGDLYNALFLFVLTHFCQLMLHIVSFSAFLGHPDKCFELPKISTYLSHGIKVAFLLVLLFCSFFVSMK